MENHGRKGKSVPRRRMLRSLWLAAAFQITGCTQLPVEPPTLSQSLHTLGEKYERLSADEDEDRPDLRWWTFWDVRAFPAGDLPPGAMHRARAQRARLQLVSPPPERVPKWEPIGPAPSTSPKYGSVSGRVRSIAVQSASVIYIGAASGGVWKTSNGGKSWTPLTDHQPSLAMGSVALDPTNPAHVYAGTGEYRGSGPAPYGAGLLKSVDGGATWTHLPGPWDTPTGGASINRVLVLGGPDPKKADDDTVLVAGTGGLHRSTSGGGDFTAASVAEIPGWVSDVVVDPTNDKVLYAARHGRGIYRWTAGGGTWTRIWAPPAGCVIHRGQLAIAATEPDVLYAAFQTNPNSCGVATGGAMWKTTNATATAPSFTLLANTPSGWCNTQCSYDLAIAVQPKDPDGDGPLEAEDIVYAGAVPLYRSTNGGSSWVRLDGTHADIHIFAFDSKGALYVGNDGGVWKHPTPATAVQKDKNWVNLNTNLAITQVHPGLTLHPSVASLGAPLALAGSQDNGTHLYRGTPGWLRVGGNDGGFTAFDLSEPSTTWYISQQYLNIQKTTDAGKSFPPAIKGISRANHPFIAPIVMCPDDPQVLVATADLGLYRSDNGAGSWQDNSPDFGPRWHDAPAAVAFARGSGCRTYFAGGRVANPQSVYLYRTTAGGGTAASRWTDISAGLPLRALTDVAVHPKDDNMVYVTFSGFCGALASCPQGQGHVWMSSNALSPTVTWTDLTGGKGLPNLPVNAIAVARTDPKQIYIGTDLGVYRSIDAGVSWTPFDHGLPNAAVTDLVINDDTGMFTAATYGRSVHRMRRPAACFWVGVGATASHTPGAAWCPGGTFLSQLDLDGAGQGGGGADFPVVGRARCCVDELPAPPSHGSCTWVTVGAVTSHQAGPPWCPGGSFLTQLDLDTVGAGVSPAESPIIGRARCCTPMQSTSPSYKMCSWRPVGGRKSHLRPDPWCVPGTYLTQIDLDAAPGASATDSPVVGRVRCCQPR